MTEVRQTHRFGYRSGEWAELLSETEHVRGRRACGFRSGREDRRSRQETPAVEPAERRRGETRERRMTRACTIRKM